MMRLLLALLLAPAAVVAQTPPVQRSSPVAAARSSAPLTSAQRWDRAYFAWEAGRYPEALTDMQAILASDDAASYHDRIAELTGERWSTIEVAKDARAPRWSPDGRHVAYETGSGAARKLTIVRAAAGFPVVLEAAGSAISFSADGRAAAWLVPVTGGSASVAWAMLGGGEPETIALDADAATAVTLLGRAPLRLAVITGNAGDSVATLRVRDLTGEDGTWRTLSLSRGQPVDIVRSANAERAIVLGGERGAFARVMPGFAGAPRNDRFAELSLSGAPALGQVIPGWTPALSADGSTLAWAEVVFDAGQSFLVKRGDAEPVRIRATSGRAQGLAIAPDGSRIAWQEMQREDWELYTAKTVAGAAPERVTREIQHDVMPQFLSPTRLLGLLGEPRHRRSHLYDLTTGVRTRLFHNNSVRTVAPEYEWVASPDGARVAIVSERDGDTVTPHRHLFVTDLNALVPHAALVARVDSNLTAERALRANGTRIFAPIAAAVRDAAAAVDVGRIYSYEKTLFGFDSKHITQPGNRKATEWLLETYRGFGLRAELQPFRTTASREIDVANVVAVIAGTVNPELVYVIGAHFDSRAEGPGADDNTSGTAMILEAARVLSTRPQPATLMFVAFTGEESGLRGAREFARRMKDSITVVGALNNDMMGWSNDHRMDNTIRYSNPGIRDVQHAAAIGFSKLITYDAFYYKNTDANALSDVWGDIIGGIGSYPILGNPHYHMTHDVLETINHQQLAETSRATVATIMLLASSPSRLTGLAASGSVVSWAPAREKGVARYIVRYGPAGDPARHTVTVTAPRATITALKPGWRVAVKAVNARGLEGWDWARGEVK